MADLQNLLNSSEEIVVLEKNPSENRYRFAIPLAGEFAKKCYNADLIMDNILPEFSDYCQFDKKIGRIRSPSIRDSIRLGRVLRPLGLELPDTLDLMALDEKLLRGFYRLSGIAVYSGGNPNKETAEVLIEKANEQGLKLPLLYSFGDLDFDEGIKIAPVDNPRRIISGNKAEKVLERFFKGISGACGVCSSHVWRRVADWYDFAYSYSVGLVDWVCAEGTRENLIEAYTRLVEREYALKSKELKAQITQLQEQATALHDEKQRAKQAFLQTLEA